MLRAVVAATILAAAVAAAPSHAASGNAKQETCKFGADSQHLKGAERTKFIKNCMANRDDPRGPASEPAPK